MILLEICSSLFKHAVWKGRQIWEDGNNLNSSFTFAASMCGSSHASVFVCTRTSVINWFKTMHSCVPFDCFLSLVSNACKWGLPSLLFLLQGDVGFPFLLIATIPINLGYILLQNAENSLRLLKTWNDFIQVSAQVCLQVNRHHFT